MTRTVRRPYRGSRAVDKTCRGKRGSCPFCRGNRTYNARRRLAAAQAEAARAAIKDDADTANP